MMALPVAPKRTKKPVAPFVVIKDRREQNPFPFDVEGVHVIDATMPTGDYSFGGARGRFVIERKAVGDLASSCTWDRDRFFREVSRLAAIHAIGGAAIVVEGEIGTLERSLADRSVNTWAIVASTLAIVAEGVPVLWCGSREMAERSTLWLLRRWAARIGVGS